MINNLHKYIGITVMNINDIYEFNNKYPNVILYQTFINNIDYSLDKHQDLIKFIKKQKLKIIIHGTYIVNLAKDIIKPWWLSVFIKEIKNSDIIGNNIGVIVHTGKHTTLSKEKGIKNMKSSLLYVAEKTINNKSLIILETSSGQGTELLSDINDFIDFMTELLNNKIYGHRFGVCIDTCHIFSSGIDISSKDGIDNFISLIKTTIGLKSIKVCHLNDSKTQLMSRKDRHENIGKGYIGKDNLLYFAKIMIKHKIPVILESPKQNIIKDYDMLINMK